MLRDSRQNFARKFECFAVDGDLQTETEERRWPPRPEEPKNQSQVEAHGSCEVRELV
jgi:hypothetical protein